MIEKIEKKNKNKVVKNSGLYGIRTLDLFFRLSFRNAKVAYITARIILHFIIHRAVHIYDFHIFITSSSSFNGFITTQFNDLLPVGLLA